MKYKSLYILFAVMFFSMSLSAQNVEEEVAFLYMKAKYLYDTDRHEDAVNAFNKVIKKDPAHEDALVLRGASKYGLAAYKGAIKDFKQSIEERGITPDVVSWMALTQYKLGQNIKAANTLTSALLVDANNPKLYMLKGEMAEANDEYLEACQAWEKAARLGDSMAERKLKKCDTSTKADVVKDHPPVEKEDLIKKDPSNYGRDMTNGLPKKDPLKSGASTHSSDRVEDNDEPNESQKDDEEVVTEKPEVDPNKRKVIEIDEDLTLEIYGENLGHRRILDQPNILMLAEEDGEVAVNICVGRTGSVKSVEYNDELSTIRKQSLISLAIRKAKEFWFVKDREKEMCGVIVYKITGS